MSGYFERTLISPVGRPMPAPLETLPDGRRLGVVSLGNGDRLTATDASWLRDLANAAHAEANAMEAEQPTVALPEGREPQTDGTQVFAVVADEPSDCDAGQQEGTVRHRTPDSNGAEEQVEAAS